MCPKKWVAERFIHDIILRRNLSALEHALRRGRGNYATKDAIWTGISSGLLMLLRRDARRGPSSGNVQDEALRPAGPPTTFKPAADDYLRDMDGGVPLSPAEMQGRNTWVLWTGGNDRFWDTISLKSAGALDFLKTLSSYPGLKASRKNRWHYLGLANEPCYLQATGPDPDRWGLWLDKRDPTCPPDPFENEANYPGVKLGARGTKVVGKDFPVGSYLRMGNRHRGAAAFPQSRFR